MKKGLLLSGVLLVVLILAACVPGKEGVEGQEEKTIAEAISENTPFPTAEANLSPKIADGGIPADAAREFTTDFSKHSVPLDEILSGGPPKDGVPSVDDPLYVSIEEADQWLESVEPVIALKIGDAARAYPIQILIWHAIANDVLDGKPVLVTFCPLCNTAIAYDRTIDGKIFDFGTTGRLRYSNMIMYDRQTETWWQQATGEAIAGELSGERLEVLPAALISWKDFKETYPEGDVLSRETGYDRSYGENPYSGYDDINHPPLLYDGPDTPDILSPLERVFTLETEGEAVAYPYKVLEKERVVNDRVGGQEIAVMWNDGTASAQDSEDLAMGRDVGAANAFYRELDGRVLTFSLNGGAIVDEQTGTTWNILGLGVEGEMKGRQLRPIVGINHFWFSWAAFRPETRIYGSDY